MFSSKTWHSALVREVLQQLSGGSYVAQTMSGLSQADGKEVSD